MEKNNLSKELQESLKRHKELLGYDPKKGPIKEINMNKIAPITKAVVGIGAILFAINHYNQVTVEDKNGISRDPKQGEVFNGKIIKMKPFGRSYNNPTGYDFVIVTKSGDKISFRLYNDEKTENFKKGDTISIKYDDKSFFMNPSSKLQSESEKKYPLNEVRRHNKYTVEDDNTDYADDETEETENKETEGGDEGDNPDFDFGGEETEGGNEDEGFGDNEDTEDVEEGGEETDEFGTADEFSAADDIESDEDSDVEEIDVTDIVKRADDAKGYAEKAVTAAEEGKNMISDLMTKFEALQQSLSKIDTVATELNTIKKDIQSQKPKEKLELRSLDSYPFNVKLTDYWNDEKLKDNYEITSGAPDAQSKDGEVKVWKLDPNEVKDFSNVDIKKSFVPESKSMEMPSPINEKVGHGPPAFAKKIPFKCEYCGNEIGNNIDHEYTKHMNDGKTYYKCESCGALNAKNTEKSRVRARTAYKLGR